MRNTTGATLLGFGIFGGIPSTLYAFTSLNAGVGLAMAALTGFLLWAGAHSEAQEDERERYERIAREMAAPEVVEPPPTQRRSPLTLFEVHAQYEAYLADQLEELIETHGYDVVFDGLWFVATNDLEEFTFSKTLPTEFLAATRVSDHFDAEMHKIWLATMADSLGDPIPPWEFCNSVDENDWAPGSDLGANIVKHLDGALITAQRSAG